MKNCGWVYYLGLLGLILDIPAMAQIMPDSSVGTKLKPNTNINGLLGDVIDGGTIMTGFN